LLDEATSANRQIPILAAHGDEDDVVSIALGLRAKELLTGAGYSIEWITYPMPHSICLEEIEAIGAWLQSRMSGN
jgi:phospholipase/carboxylesterase